MVLKVQHVRLKHARIYVRDMAFVEKMQIVNVRLAGTVKIVVNFLVLRKHLVMIVLATENVVKKEIVNVKAVILAKDVAKNHVIYVAYRMDMVSAI